MAHKDSVEYPGHCSITTLVVHSVSDTTEQQTDGVGTSVSGVEWWDPTCTARLGGGDGGAV